jgi:hypothetical protein
MLNLKERWEKVKAAKMASRKRRAPHKSSAISGRRKIQRFGTYYFFCVLFFWLCNDYIMILIFRKYLL